MSGAGHSCDAISDWCSDIYLCTKEGIMMAEIQSGYRHGYIGYLGTTSCTNMKIFFLAKYIANFREKKREDEKYFETFLKTCMKWHRLNISSLCIVVEIYAKWCGRNGFCSLMI